MCKWCAKIISLWLRLQNPALAFSRANHQRSLSNPLPQCAAHVTTCPCAPEKSCPSCSCLCSLCPLFSLQPSQPITWRRRRWLNYRPNWPCNRKLRSCCKKTRSLRVFCVLRKFNDGHDRRRNISTQVNHCELFSGNNKRFA